MSQERIKKAIADKKMLCPECKKPIQKYEKYQDLMGQVWDGAGDSFGSNAGSKVTLTCGNDACEWKERTEYWENYIQD
jgi:hypothetical protein